jgi:hypothetical protein
MSSVCNCPSKTTNYILITQTQNPVTIGQHEYITCLRKFRVSYVSLNLAVASSALATLATAPNITVRSKAFASITNNSYSFINGDRFNVIASFPNHFGDYATNVAFGRVTAKFTVPETDFNFLQAIKNLNSYDISLQFDNGAPLILDVGDFWSVCIETKNFEG